MPANGNDPIHKLARSDKARFLMEVSPFGLVMIDAQGTIRSFSKVAEAMFGYRESEVLGSNVKMLMPEPHRSQHDGYLEHYQQTGEKRILKAPRLENALHHDGGLFPIELTITETSAEGEACFLAFIRKLDATEAHRREMSKMLSDLAHSSRVSAMGALATAIAHELNQPLTSIVNYTEGLRTLISRRDDFADREEYVRILESCNRQAIRAGQLLHRMREFIKGGETHRESAKISDLLQEATSLVLINGYKQTVRIEYDIEEGLPDVHVDLLQGQQLFFNLIRNAIEAMDLEHGAVARIKVSARSEDRDFVLFTICDNGPGIDPEIADSLFSGFVTTKSDGMGVGLAICKQIVEGHGGRIWVERSQELGGAEFYFTLPVEGSTETGMGE